MLPYSLNIKPDQHIKCIFKNGTIIEGIVQFYSKEEITLLSLHDNSQMIILHPNDDLMMIKIMPIKKQENEGDISENIADKLKETQAAEDPNLQNKTIEELKELVVKQEKLIIANKIRQHFPKDFNKTNYNSQASIFARKKS